jgi:hypothetical protein
MLKYQFNKPTCKNRMNIGQDKETIYLLEDCDDICKSKIKEAEVIPNSKNIFLNRITVECFDYMNGSEEKEFFIDDLKSIFYFVKIFHTYNKEENEMNFLVLKEQLNNSLNLINDDENEILKKINDKACLGNKIKKILKIDEFPLENYILKKEQVKVDFYDKIYYLKKKNSLNNNISNMSSFNNIINQNINNISHISNNNNNNNGLNNIFNYNNLNNNDLIDRMNKMEERIRCIERKLDIILDYIKK